MTIEVHIFNTKNVSLEQLLESNYFLDKTKFDNFTHLEIKKEKIVSEIFKRKYIGEYSLNEFNKPISKDKFFNISHSKGYVAFVMDVVPIGIDIEKIRDFNPKLIDFISNEEEQKYIRSAGNFYEIWTNKEALVKACGSGIKQKINTIPSLPLNSFKEYNSKIYYNKTIKCDDLIITVSRESKEDFEIKIIWETL